MSSTAVPLHGGSPSGLTAPALLKALVDQQALDEHELPRMLGPDRHRLTIARLERALERANTMRDADLLAIKSRLSGLRPADPSATAAAGVAPEVARKVLGVQLADSPTTVAVVQPKPEALAAIADQLGVAPSQLDVRISTLRAVTLWVRALEKGKDAVLVPEPLPDIWTLLDRLVEMDGSDIHLTVGDPPKIRVYGRLETLPMEPVPETWLKDSLSDLTGINLTKDFEGLTNVNKAVAFGPHRFRLVIARGQTGPTLVARKLSSVIPTMASLNLMESIQNLITLERGLVLVTGPTGSGKSTTLASMLQAILSHQPRKVITLEDPVEYRLSSGMGAVDQRELNNDFSAFDVAISTALRQDPDVILVGEMRDRHTVKAALEACETGHLVFSTLHTFDAPSALTRIVDFFPADEQDSIRNTLSYIISAVVAQSLLPSQVQGQGRVAAFEVMLANTAIRNNLKTPEGLAQIRGIMSTSSREGMTTMEQYLAKLVKARQIHRKDAEFRAQDLDALNRLLDS